LLPACFGNFTKPINAFAVPALAGVGVNDDGLV
jgi:hypothetical protein